MHLVGPGYERGLGVEAIQGFLLQDTKCKHNYIFASRSMQQKDRLVHGQSVNILC